MNYLLLLAHNCSAYNSSRFSITRILSRMPFRDAHAHPPFVLVRFILIDISRSVEAS